MPDDIDEAFERYNKSRALRESNLGLHKDSFTSHKNDKTKASNRQLSFKLSKGHHNLQKSLKCVKSVAPGQASDKVKRKTIFCINQKSKDIAATVYTSYSSPFCAKKNFQISPSPGGSMRKKFFINPQPIKSRILDL